MWKQDAKQNLRVLFRAGLPFTLLGIGIVMGGLYLLKYYFGQNEYLGTILLVWLGLFWVIYQPLFSKKTCLVRTQAERE